MVFTTRDGPRGRPGRSPNLGAKSSILEKLGVFFGLLSAHAEREALLLYPLIGRGNLKPASVLRRQKARASHQGTNAVPSLWNGRVGYIRGLHSWLRTAMSTRSLIIQRCLLCVSASFQPSSSGRATAGNSGHADARDCVAYSEAADRRTPHPTRQGGKN